MIVFVKVHLYFSNKINNKYIDFYTEINMDRCDYKLGDIKIHPNKFVTNWGKIYINIFSKGKLFFIK